MMRFFAIIGALTIAFTTQANAAGERSCSNGTIEERGDGHYAIEVTPLQITFRPYEGSFTIEDWEHDAVLDTFFITDRPVTVTSEGTEFQATIRAVLIFSPTRDRLSALISMDNGPFRTLRLNCTR